MQLDFSTFYLIAYILTVFYYFILGCILFAQRAAPNSTRIERENKLNMLHSVGGIMFFEAIDYVLYIPAIWGSGNDVDKFINVCFLVTMMIETPLLYIVMHAIVQKRVNTWRWTIFTASPFLALTLWYVLTPSQLTGRLPVFIASVFSVLYTLFLLFRYSKEYRHYIQCLKSEYSNISSREIIWSWSCFCGFAAQMIVFQIYAYNRTPQTELVYWALSLINAAYLCYCTCRQKTLDMEFSEDNNENKTAEAVPSPSEEYVEKSFFSIIEQKLQSVCKEKHLFLDPDLTREMLCRHLSISSTYLKQYFHSRNLTFYQYINTLRVEYAYKLMEENPSMPIHKVSELSGFRSQTTFRKMFQEVKGCLPSEIKNHTPK